MPPVLLIAGQMRYSKRCVYTVKGFNHGSSWHCELILPGLNGLCHNWYINAVNPRVNQYEWSPARQGGYAPWNRILTPRWKPGAAPAAAAALPRAPSGSSRLRSQAFASMPFFWSRFAAIAATSVCRPARLGRCCKSGRIIDNLALYPNLLHCVRCDKLF